MTVKNTDTLITERRLHPRIASDIQIQGNICSKTDQDLGELQGAKLFNVSLGGIAFTSDKPVQVGCKVTITGDKVPRRNNFKDQPVFLILETIETNDPTPKYFSRCQIIDGQVPIHWMHQHTPQRNY